MTHPNAPSTERLREAGQRIYVDCEFNGFGGDLISMALAADDGREWYGVLPLPPIWDAWCADNVLPMISAINPTIYATSRDEFRISLLNFLLGFDNPIIVADWYVDLVHFFHAFEGRSHELTISYKCRAELVPDCPDIAPGYPHNALSDARAIRRALNGGPSDAE